MLAVSLTGLVLAMHITAQSRPSRGLKAGGDVFLVFKARFAQVHVGINATGHEHKASGVKNFAAVVSMVACRGHGDNLAVPHQQVYRGFKVACVLYQEAHARAPSLRVASR